MMKKKVCTLVSLVFVIGIMLMAFSGCTKAETWNVTFYDGDTVVKTVAVDKDGWVENFVPNPKGEFVFDKWYVSPNLKVLFDFTKPITADTKIFGAFRSNVADTRSWELAGSGSIEPLKSNNWGKGNAANIAASTLVKADDSNEFVITVTLYPGDLFQLAVIDPAADRAWKVQHGKKALKNSGEYFEGEESLGDADANIKVIKAGKFKITLTTDAKNASLDTIAYTVLGEAPPLVPIPVPIVSGNINSSGIYADDATAKASGAYLAQVGTTKVYEGTINFNKGDFFCVLPFNNWSGKLTAGNLTADSTGVKIPTTAAAKTANIDVTEAGQYKVTVDMTNTDSIKYTVKVTRLGEFEYNPTKHTQVNVYNVGGTVDYQYYVTKGGKMVTIPAATPTDDTKSFAGWYNGENAFSFNTVFNVAGLTIDLTPKEILKTEVDPRSYVLFGEKITVGDTDIGSWTNGNALVQSADCIHTLDIKFKAAGGQLTLKEKNGNIETGYTINRANVTGITTDETIIKKSPGNIMFSKAGSFTLSFNSITQVLTITEKA